MITPLGTDQVRLITFDETQTDGLHRIGGRAPAGLEPKDKTSHYLLTIGVEEDLCLSLFLKDDVDFFIEETYKVFTLRDSCVEVIFHKPTPRRDDDLYQGIFHGHGLSFSLLQKDEMLNADYDPEDEYSDEIIAPDPRGKLGGRAYLNEHHMRSFLEKIEEGFHQFLQLDGTDVIFLRARYPGNFPYYLGRLHLYLRPSKTGYDWCCFIEDG